jgi:hypothetical protein
VSPDTATHHDISTVLAREPCAGCGAPLGADQRYCLSCGIPRSGTRLPFLDVLHAEASAAGIVEQGSQPTALLRVPALTPSTSGGGVWAGGATPQGGVGGWLRENAGLLALLGVLLLALLIGLLLGHWVSGGSRNIATVPAKQVVEIKGLPAVTAAPAATTPAPTATAPTSNGTNGGNAAGSAAGGSGETASATHTAHAANPTVNTLSSSTGKEHAKAVEKALSKGGGTLTTGGAPPPKETHKSGAASKPIGGGSEVTSIE